MPPDPRLIPPEVTPPSPFLDHTGQTEGAVGEALYGQPGMALQNLAACEMDWDTYREEFNKEHGGCPVQIDEWLVWEDGWRCDAYDPGGTELPPPQEPHKLRELQVAYYEACRAQLRTFRDAHRNYIEMVESIQVRKSMPLQMRSVSWTRRVGDDGFDSYLPLTKHDRLDLAPSKQALADLEQDIARCEKRIRELNPRE